MFSAKFIIKLGLLYHQNYTTVFILLHALNAYQIILWQGRAKLLPKMYVLLEYILSMNSILNDLKYIWQHKRLYFIAMIDKYLRKVICFHVRKTK